MEKEGPAPVQKAAMEKNTIEEGETWESVHL